MTARKYDYDLVFHFIGFYQNLHGYPPSIREIQKQFNVTTTSAVNHILDRLEEDGKISRTPGIARGITITAPL